MPAHTTHSVGALLSAVQHDEQQVSLEKLQSKILTGEFIATIEFGTNIVNYTKF